MKRKTTAYHYPYYAAPAVLLLLVLTLYGDDLLRIRQLWEEDEELPFAVHRETDSGCDLFRGRWVYDEAARPLYEEEECPYIPPQLGCQKEGRPDRGYQHWRWQPHGCSLHRFNATLMLEKLRGKRMLFVGDSLNRGQFISMVCLLHRVIPRESKSMLNSGSIVTFTAKDYNATVEFYWAPFLLESNSDDGVVHRFRDRIVRAGSIENHARHWSGADVIVFNTFVWWLTGQKMKIMHGSFPGDMKDIELMETEDAYRLAMKSMVRWVEQNMDPRRTRVFFTTMSPYHERSSQWRSRSGRNCYNETVPIEDPTFSGAGWNAGIMRVVEEELAATKVPIALLNITQLSAYRKDAHTSIYKKQWEPLTAAQLADPEGYADCVHWCLPGVQDTWNELLYSILLFPTKVR